MNSTTTTEIKAEVEKLVSYIVKNPAVNLTVFSNQVLDPSQALIAKFSNHLQACVAIRSIREQLTA